MSSGLCCHHRRSVNQTCGQVTSIDIWAKMYDDELNSILDQLIPARPITRRRRPADP